MVEYSFYLNTYGGVSVPLEDWPMISKRAADKLAYYKRIYTVTAPDENAEAMAICAMADAMAYFIAAQNGTGGAVASVGIGSVSVSYGRATVDLSPKAQEKELYCCACRYLDIYRGVC